MERPPHGGTDSRDQSERRSAQAVVAVLGSRNAAHRQAQYEQFLLTVEIFPFDAGVGRRAAEIRHSLERRGEGIGPLDTLIAATAIYRGATLVTRNVREFGRVRGLSLADWYS